MATPEQILSGGDVEKHKKKAKPAAKPAAAKGSGGGSTEFSIPKNEAADPTQPYPVNPRPGATTTTWRQFRGSGRVVKIPTGFSAYHHFDGVGRPVRAAFYTA